jgi:hypothetical protein
MNRTAALSSASLRAGPSRLNDTASATSHVGDPRKNKKRPRDAGPFHGAYVRRLSSFCRFRMVVDLRFRKLAEGAVGVFLFIERGIEQVDGVLVAQLGRPRL